MDTNKKLSNIKKQELNDIVKNNIMNLAETLKRSRAERIKSDIVGSYTGLDFNNGNPEQDADDL